MDPGASGFIHYRHDPRNEATLSHNTILSLHEDRRGNLWIGTNAGLNVLETPRDAFPASNTIRPIPTASVMTM